jgi:hypothetical protein
MPLRVPRYDVEAMSSSVTKRARAKDEAAKRTRRGKNDSSSAEALADKIQNALADVWLPHIYRERIRTQRTRAFNLPAKAKKDAPVEIQHTLLGVELKIGRRRISCPDLATARYLAVFARIGVEAVAVPYDITRISTIADELESAWHKMPLLIEQETRERRRAFQTRVRQTLIERIAREIREAGAGASVPQFNQNTKQRKSSNR